MKSLVTHDLKNTQTRTLTAVGGDVKWCYQYGKQYGDSLRH